MKNRKIAAVLTAVMLSSALMTGCAEQTLNTEEVAATFDGGEISLGVANFAAKIQQAETESYYMALFGPGMWNQDMGGFTFEESVKESTLSMLQELYVVCSHAEEYGVSLTDEEQQKIADAAAAFVADNNEKTLTRMTATEDVVKEYLELMTVQKKVSDEIIKDVDTNVSDEEAAQKTINYVYISTSSYTNEDGETAEYTEEEVQEKIELAEKILSEAKEHKDLESAASGNGLNISTVSYGKDDEALTEEVYEAAEKLKEGEYSGVVEAEYGCYVIEMVSEFDKEATEARKIEIIGERETALYDEVYASWSEGLELTVNEDVWAQVNFDAPLTVVTGTEE